MPMEFYYKWNIEIMLNLSSFLWNSFGVKRKSICPTTGAISMEIIINPMSSRVVMLEVLHTKSRA